MALTTAPTDKRNVCPYADEPTCHNAITANCNAQAIRMSGASALALSELNT